MERPSEEIIQKMYEKAKADGTIKSDKEFVDRVVANGWYTEKEMMKGLAYDKDGNFVEALEQDYTVDDDSPINDVEQDNSYGWGRSETNYDTNKEDASDLWQDAAWAAASNPGILKNIPLGNIPNKLFNGVINGISNKILSNPKATEYLMENFADNAFKIFDPKKDKAIIDELITASKNAVGDKADDATRAVAEKVSEETKKKIVGKLVGTIVQGLYTDYKMIHDTNKDNNSGLNKDARWASALDAVDSATETLPIVNWIDLGLDLALSGSKDKNGESYSKGGLLSKLNYLVNDLSGDGSARTIWENDQEKQEEVKKGNEWMEKQGFKGSWFNTGKPSAKEGSKADVMLKNDKAIDKIQGNTAGRGKKSTDGVSVDKEQQDKRDANLYISRWNRNKGLNLDDKKAYTYKDFTNDFYQKDDGTWVNKKTKQTAGEMRRKLKDNTNNPAGDTINN